MCEPNGGDLLARVRAGEEEAARQFFREHHALVARIVHNHASRRHSEEDLCQMIFLKIFTRLDQYAGEVPVAHWISRIAVNTCLVELKKDAHRKELREADLGEDVVTLLQRVADPATQQTDGVRDAQEVTRQLLERLSPTDRMIMSLLYIEQHSVAETSRLTGQAQAVVKIRAFRARRKLNKLIQQLGDRLL